MKEIKIDSIKLRVGDRELDLTPDEVRELKEQLVALLGPAPYIPPFFTTTTGHWNGANDKVTLS